ncbi:hypothetical protein MNBD_GAMMA01-1888 [hydrothermal vent metagenome]|uniref:DUF4166 domain-containing protein n=1 Tax=hydrothermal vent metagenome TaxID=652676 RepID=A0A3B0UXH8_9ZZZZ
MKQKSLMQQALGEQWHKLPQALKNHYRVNEQGENSAEGKLNIYYPWFMQLPLTFMRLFGALVNRRGKNLDTKVSKTMKGDSEYWHRIIEFPNGKQINFNSIFVTNGHNEFIEYINSVLGLKMTAFVEDNKLRYESNGYVLKLGKLKIPIPEWLALGHASIVEWEYDKNDPQTFAMDFRIKHPLFGEVFCYEGKFITQLETESK